ncbi:hypothetical protein TNCV_4862391 [Trichonephila clavipes]|nr:hypothetical protein TNCV_4862391 [Trichonephila clavipes]
MPLDNKCRIGPLAGAPPDTCAVVISTETESDSSLKMTRLQSVTHPSCPRSAKNPVDTAYDVGVSGKRLSGRRLLKPTSVSRLLMVSLDGTGCLEGATTISPDRGGGRYVYSTNLLPLRPIIRPYQSPSAARTAAGYVLEAS